METIEPKDFFIKETKEIIDFYEKIKAKCDSNLEQLNQLLPMLDTEVEPDDEQIRELVELVDSIEKNSNEFVLMARELDRRIT